jgi:hypothetical protein
MILVFLQGTLMDLHGAMAWETLLDEERCDSLAMALDGLLF